MVGQIVIVKLPTWRRRGDIGGLEFSAYMIAPEVGHTCPCADFMFAGDLA